MQNGAQWDGWTRVRIVGSFEELVETPWSGGVNALCWQRTLAGDFAEVLAQVAAGDGLEPLDEARLVALPVGPDGRVAVAMLIADLRRLRGRGLQPVLDCIHAYPRDEDDAIVRTDVYSFHADRAPVAADTYLCTYVGAPSEGLANEEARRKVDDPATRAALRREYGGPDDDGFKDYLRENCYDLHYAATTGAQPFSFGIGNLWRIAIEYPGCPVPPCIHRAPETRPGERRLLLIS